MSLTSTFFGNAARAFYFGNWFYGVCAVALSVEAALQQRQPVNGTLYHLLLFFGTVVFYTHPYRLNTNVRSANERAAWYARNHRAMHRLQLIGGVLVVILFARHSYQHVHAQVYPSLVNALLLLTFPLIALAYYGAGKLNLRSVGWSKPFVIGFVWAGVVTVYPLVFSSWSRGDPYPFTLVGLLLFLKNFMFIAMLGILFDIKDHAVDSRTALRTFVVQLGLRTTIFRMVIPLTIVGLGTFLLYGSTHGFSTMKLLLNIIPFALLFAVAYSLRRRRSILYYLMVVDGLMLVKALCGSVAMVFF